MASQMYKLDMTTVGLLYENFSLKHNQNTGNL